MTLPWLDQFSSARHKMQEMDDALGFKLSEMIASGSPKELNKTENAQPAILAMSALILEVLMEDYKVPVHTLFDYTLGHSLGEFTALAISGMMDLPATIKLVRARGLAMSEAAAQASAPSSMIALVVERGRSRFVVEQLARFREAQGLLDSEVLCVANYNSDSQVVVAGHDTLLRQFIDTLKRFDGRDPRAIKLPLSAPFHTPIMQSAQQQMLGILEGMPLQLPPLIKLVSNVTARALPDDDAGFVKRAIARQCTETVRWHESVEYLRERDVTRFLSIGPSMVARKLVEATVGKDAVLHVGKVEDLDGVVKKLLS
ncbi:acyl transferase/acyl hydrolase/lysophospholipase [Protomyces lactucae-debilis]|uniref:[acyl-carrier-protein] S-malonyltransferase n=1 Tax=Protomyces lactucae-debilis TaxID=2754530 RepID=A0A1Y2ETC7_PROLT|nr:acyl transferase/acyl hydrolase/lysophospholipase [Protomyces lactucae-debilis]ORY74821.1 acyl transferase/acyl hydrolase/lysophospholipase [Protomyces lactucae-debilis]